MPPQAHRVFHSQPLEVDGANVSQTVQVQGRPNKRAVGYAMSPPKTSRSSLRSSSFAPVFVPSPLHAIDVDVDPRLFRRCRAPQFRTRSPFYHCVVYQKWQRQDQGPTPLRPGYNTYHLISECTWSINTLHHGRIEARPVGLNFSKSFSHYRYGRMQLHVYPKQVVLATRHS